MCVMCVCVCECGWVGGASVGVWVGGWVDGCMGVGV